MVRLLLLSGFVFLFVVQFLKESADPDGKERMDMAKYPLIILLSSLGLMMLFQPELLCKIISFFVVKNSEASDYRLSFVRLRGLFCIIAAVLLVLFL